MAPDDLVARQAEDAGDAVALLRAGRPPAQHDGQDALLFHAGLLGELPHVEAAALERRVVEAIAQARYTPSPEQRRRLAAALGVSPEQVAWGHQAQVAHVYGHGPQFGRSP